MRAVPRRPSQPAGQLALQAGLRPRAFAGTARGIAGAAAHQASHRRASGRFAHRRHQDGEGPDPPPVGPRRGEQGCAEPSRWCWPTRSGKAWWPTTSPSMSTGSHRRHTVVETYTEREVQQAAGGAGRRPARTRLGVGIKRSAPRRDRRVADGPTSTSTLDLTIVNNRVSAGGQDGRERSEERRRHAGRCRCRIGWCRC